MSRFSFIPIFNILLLILAFCQTETAMAQEMSISLDEISIVGSKKSLYSSNHQLIVIDSAELRSRPGSDLADLLTSQTHLNITRYGGHGSLSSIRLRGTAPAHTQVNWNGIPINSPTTGMVDLGMVPGGMADRVEVVSGASGVLFGNGTFGGAVNLENRADWTNRLNLRGYAEAGSWNHGLIGLSIQTGGRQFQYHLGGAFQSSPNTYPYKNNFKAGQPVELRINDSLTRANVQQHFFLRLPGNWFVQAGNWLYSREKALPPAASSNPSWLARQTDAGSRHYLKLNKWAGNHLFGFSAARFDDTLNYSERLVANDSVISSSGIRTANSFLGLSHRWNASPVFSMESGADLEIQQGLSGSFSGPVRDRRGSLYLLARLGGEKLKMAAGIRQEFNETRTPWPLLSLYPTYRLNERLSLRGSFSNKFRLPNLNEKFWKPGGNPDLLPETGFGGDLGLSWNTRSDSRFSQHASLNLFAQEVNNWIQWLPAGTYWAPMNIRKVQCQGVEAEWGSTVRWNVARLRSALTYTYTESLDMSRVGVTDRLDRQLAYVPLHSLRAQAAFGHGPLDGTLSVAYYGKRHTTDVHDPWLDLPGYSVADLMLGYQMNFKKSELTVRFKVNNLFNSSFQTIRGYPSPGRSLSLMLIYSLQQNQSNE